MYVDPHTGRVVATVVTASRVARTVTSDTDVVAISVAETISANEVEISIELDEPIASTDVAFVRGLADDGTC